MGTYEQRKDAQRKCQKRKSKIPSFQECDSSKLDKRYTKEKDELERTVIQGVCVQVPTNTVGVIRVVVSSVTATLNCVDGPKAKGAAGEHDIVIGIDPSNKRRNPMPSHSRISRSVYQGKAESGQAEKEGTSQQAGTWPH